ncbi:MAG: Na(+)-translocating NADH-quinone reductase subunit A [Oligoflexales bacterium]|nr:Na(+)-translocating NADH-quinone reductase subunit A [Oligoflexales bacterium]
MIKIKKGLDLPIDGEPRQELGECPSIKSVAVIGDDYVGMKPTMAVKVGDEVKAGQELFSDKKNPGVIFTAPASGKVVAISRGQRRALQSVQIELDGKNEALSFESYKANELDGLDFQKVHENLVKSGLWVSLRTRPFSKVPSLESKPAAIFVNAMDTNPLSPYPGVVIEAHKKNFESGMKVIAHLTAGSVYLCHDPHTYLPTGLPSKVKVHEFSGVHPAGLVGTHIHFLEPVSEKKTVWHISYQDVIAVGKLFTTGKVWGKRMVSLAGPLVKDPCLYEVPLGANTEDLCKGLVEDDDMRVVSGSLFSGHHAQGPFSFLGRYHLQVCVLREGRERELLGWQMPGFDKFSVKNAFFSKLLPGGRKFAFTTSTGGSVRAMVPVGSYEKVMPLDVEPTFLLRSLLSRDLEQAALLGVLELDEEDLGLCTFVCPGKVEYGPMLREILTTIEKEG